MREYRLAAMTHSPSSASDLNRYLASFCDLVADKVASLGASDASADVLNDLRRDMLALAAMGDANPVATYAWTHALSEEDGRTEEHR